MFIQPVGSVESSSVTVQVCCPNGMDWDQDKGVFYFIDTADSVVRSYPVDENGVPKRSHDGVLVGVREVSLKRAKSTYANMQFHNAQGPCCCRPSEYVIVHFTP